MVKLEYTRKLKILIMTITTIVYCFLFVFLHIEFGPRVAALAVVPTIIAGRLFGMWGGMIAGVLCFILHIPLYVVLGEEVLPSFIRYYSGAITVEQLSVVAIGGIVGRIHDLNLKTKKALRELEKADVALRKAKDELEDKVKERTIELERNYDDLRQEYKQRQQIEEALRYRCRLEELVATISTNFIKLSLDEIDQGVKNALESIGKFASVDSIQVFLIHENRETIGMAYEWTKNGAKSQKDRFQSIDVKAVPWLMEKLNRFEFINFHDPSELPSTSVAEQEIFEWYKMKSYSAVPIIYGEVMRGFLAFVSIGEKKRWLKEDIVLLQTMGDIFINALERKTAEEMKVTERVRSEFLTNITHEFRTPLTLALGPLEELLMNRSLIKGRPIKEMLQMSFRNVRKLLHLVNQLLDFSSLEAGGTFLSYQKRDMRVFVSSVIDFFSDIASRKNIKTVFTHQEGDFTAYIDPEKMDKVLVNVIGNAYKFTPEGGIIEIKCQVVNKINQIDKTKRDSLLNENGSNEYVEIIIKDNGVGIKSEDLGKIFERFYHNNRESTSIVRGTGLGLPLAKNLLALQGGNIHVESIYGKGATCIIQIPKGMKHIKDERLIAQETDDEPEVPHNVKEYMELPETEDEEKEETVQGDKDLILIVDDNSDVRDYIKSILKSEYQTLTAQDGNDAIEKLTRHSPSLIISDIMMPVMDGYELCKRLKSSSEFSHIPFIFLTAKTDMEMKISGLEKGADDYIVKPFSSLELKARIKSLLINRKLVSENLEMEDKISSLTHQLEDKYYFHNIITKSKVMQEIFQVMESVKDTDHPVLISGETGTGKELIAKSLHYHSSRKERPFIVRNCSALSDQLLQSEVFGHVKGAFTGATRDKMGLFELAHGGTLFLDEIADMSGDTQAKFLRVLEYGTFYSLGGDKEKKVDVRIITATNRDLRKMVRENTFREDLYYRLNVLTIALPPLRDRKEDIPLLIKHFLDEISKKHNRKKGISPQALKQLMLYSYPGNIRELKNILEKSYFLSSARTIQLKDFPPEVWEPTSSSSKPLKEMAKSAKHLEREMIIEALKQARKNKTKAAKILNITRPTLYKQMKHYKIDPDVI
jgi:DNA-binding NtrC family response regulator/signal transduction histidine kinase